MTVPLTPLMLPQEYGKIRQSCTFHPLGENSFVADKNKRSETGSDPELDRHLKSFENRLDALDEKLGRFRIRRSRAQIRNRRGTAMGMAFRLVTELIAGLVVGGFLGWWIDKWLGTMPLFLLIFFVLGTAAGILNVIRTARSIQKDAGDGDDTAE
ncbi:MAG TPA: AtpZ/AtpI family protein [Rhizobiales bacterium]|nr:AtpZ/AtpI family protein [Hyphomicrobiales bacterium]